MLPPVRRQLRRLAIAVTAAGLLAFAASNPDGRVARRNVERWRTTGRIDVATLAQLSADAVPALRTLPDRLRAQTLGPIRARTPRDGLLSWSRARAEARGG